MSLLKIALKTGCVKLGARIPINVKHLITFRCNLSCKYCYRHPSDWKEMSTEDIKACMNSFRAMGAEYWSFSGGEPLLRKDLGELINFARSIGLKPTVTSNGILVPKYIHKLKGLHQITLSLDSASAKIHDQIRGKGSFDKVINAIKILRAEHIDTNINAIVTSTNYNSLDELIVLAEGYDCHITIFPVSGAEEYDPKDMNSPSDFLIRRSKETNTISHTLRYLKYLPDYPKLPKQECWYGKAFCTIYPDGQVATCSQLFYDDRFKNMKFASGLEHGWETAFKRLDRVIRCDACFSCFTEYNIALNHPFNSFLHYVTHKEALR